MKYLNHFLIIGVFILFASIHRLWAMQEANAYGEEKTEQLRQYLNAIVETSNLEKTQPSSEEFLVVEKLVTLGANPKVANDCGVQAIHLAAAKGVVELIQVLLKHGTDIEAKGNLDRNALHYAALYGHRNTIDLLVNLGANIEAENTNGDTPLYFARHNKDTIIKLLALGANIQAKSYNGHHYLYQITGGAVLDFILTYFDVVKGNLPGEPELHKAIRLKNDETELKQILFDSQLKSPGINIDQFDTYGQTALN